MQDHDYEPDPEFVERVEWQLRREARRLDRFAAAPTPRWRRLRAAAVVAVSLAVGFASATAAQRAEDRAQRRLLMMQAEGGVQIAELRVQASRERFELVEERARVGTVDAIELHWIELELRHAEQSLEHARLELDEVRRSGAAPRGDLIAPEVDGIDFVTARQALELERLGQTLAILDIQYESLRDDVALGTRLREELAHLATEMVRVRSQQGQVERSMQLRQAYLSGDLDADDVLRTARREQAESALEVAEAQLREARRQADRVRTEIEIGTVPALMAREAEIQVAQAELGVRLARLEAQLFRRQER